MSEMVRRRGIIKRLSTKKTIKEVYEKLVATDKIDGAYTELNKDGTPYYIDSDKYDIINGDIFDISGAPQEYDTDEEIAEATRLNDTDYDIHIYYYNGGDSPINDAIAEADREYEDKVVYYAIKFSNGKYLNSTSGTAPAIYTTPGRAKAALRLRYYNKDSEYEIVKFAEVQ